MTPDENPELTPKPTPDDTSESVPDTTSEISSEPELDSASEPAPEPELAAEPEPAPEPELATEPEPAIEPEPAAEPTVKPGPVAEPVAEPTPAPAPAPTASVFDPVPAEQTKKSHTGLILGIIIGLILIVAILVVVFVVIIPNSKKADENGGSTSVSQQDPTPTPNPTPSNPVDPTPADPVSPDDPVTPTDPTPADPTNPTNPVTPTDPTPVNPTPAQPQAVSAVGKYKAVAMVDEKGKEDSEDIESMAAVGAYYELEFKKDGTGSMAIKMDMPEEIKKQLSAEELRQLKELEQAFPVTWNNGSITLKDPETGSAEKGTYKLSKDGKYITIIFNGSGIKFVRL